MPDGGAERRTGLAPTSAEAFIAKARRRVIEGPARVTATRPTKNGPSAERLETPRAARGRFGKLPKDRLRYDGGEWSMVPAEWFDARFSLMELAILIFVLAGTGEGPHVFMREIEKRFGICRQTAARHLSALVGQYIAEEKPRSGKGRFKGTRYTVLKQPATEQPATEPTGDGTTGDGNKPPILKTPIHM